MMDTFFAPLWLFDCSFDGSIVVKSGRVAVCRFVRVERGLEGRLSVVVLMDVIVM